MSTVTAMPRQACPEDCPCRRPRLEPDGFMGVYSAPEVSWSYEEVSPGVYQVVYRTEASA